MRTTIKIEDDIAAVLNREMRRTGEPLKRVLDRFLRLGVAASKQPPRKPFKVKAWNLQPPAGQSFDNVEELIEFLEGPYHR